MLCTIVLARFVGWFVLARHPDGPDSANDSRIAVFAGWAATALFWIEAAVFAAIGVETGSYAFIPAIVLLAGAVGVFLSRWRADSLRGSAIGDRSAEPGPRGGSMDG